MSKLNLANLAQNELSKDEAQKAKGGLICTCYCVCYCAAELKFDLRVIDQEDERIWTRENS